MSSLALRWILLTSLTASPLLAYPPQEGAVSGADGGMVQVLDENKNPLVGTSILSTVLMDSPRRVSALILQDTNANGEITTGRTARELGKPAAPPAPDDKRAEPGGKTWSELIVAALIAGGVVALILLLRGHHGSPGVAAAPAPAAPRVQSPPPATGTILAPGTPTVGSPR